MHTVGYRIAETGCNPRDSVYVDKMAKIGIYGGSFDPVHLGHLLLAECAREQLHLDRVLFVPTATPPHKVEQAMTPGRDRVEMLRLATGGVEAFEVNSYEVDRGGVNYTYETLAHFHAEDSQAELFFLLGADMFTDLPNWRHPERVCELALPVAVGRPGWARIDEAILAGIVSPERFEAIRAHRVDMPLVDLSSTDIRRRVAAGLSIRYRVPRAVEMYIYSQRLYRLSPNSQQEPKAIGMVED